MAYSATNRIIHKGYKNVNALGSFFWEYFGFFQGKNWRKLHILKWKTEFVRRREYADDRKPDW